MGRIRRERPTSRERDGYLPRSRGWWMFNFGRNLAHPTEAYYHAVFLGCMLMVIRRRHGWALALAALLSISHPFNGLSLALILTAHSLLELLIRRPRPGYFSSWRARRHRVPRGLLPLVP